MQKLAALFAIALTFVAASAGFAQRPPRGDAAVYGAGNASCGSWVAERAQARDSKLVGMHFGWVQGFLSGYGYRGIDFNMSLRDTDFDAIDAWMRRYCEAHPLDRIVDAAVVLAEELAKP